MTSTLFIQHSPIDTTVPDVDGASCAIDRSLIDTQESQLIAGDDLPSEVRMKRKRFADEYKEIQAEIDVTAEQVARTVAECARIVEDAMRCLANVVEKKRRVDKSIDTELANEFPELNDCTKLLDRVKVREFLAAKNRPVESLLLPSSAIGSQFKRRFTPEEVEKLRATETSDGESKSYAESYLARYEETRASLASLKPTTQSCRQSLDSAGDLVGWTLAFIERSSDTLK